MQSHLDLFSIQVAIPLSYYLEYISGFANALCTSFVNDIAMAIIVAVCRMSENCQTRQSQMVCNKQQMKYTHKWLKALHKWFLPRKWKCCQTKSSCFPHLGSSQKQLLLINSKGILASQRDIEALEKNKQTNKKTFEFKCSVVISKGGYSLVFRFIT